MKNIARFVSIVFACLFVLLSASACSRVPPGNVGVKVYLLGGDKGVNQEVLGVGRYWIGINEELYLFPTFQQNYVWTANKDEGSPNDESITFQTKEGMSVNADVGITYHLNPDKVSDIFQKYRKGVVEITDIFLRNSVRDAINSFASSMAVEEVYGPKKVELFDKVQASVKQELDETGIVIDKIYLIGNMRLPEQVVQALNDKISATQRAQQRENEVAEATAQAQKDVAIANGEAQALLVKAKAEAEANKLRRAALSTELVQYEAIQKWNGQLPQFTGGSGVPFIQVQPAK